MTDFLIDNPSAFRGQYGPWALIGGASDGTGEEFARQLAATGVNCVLAARRGEALDALAAELQDQYGVKVFTMVVDLSTPDAAATLCKAISGLEIGLFVANAGAGEGGNRFLDGPMNQWNRLMNLNIHTPLETCHRLVPAMVKRGRGGVVLMCSGIALGGQPRTSVYGASKAFGLNFAEALWAEMKGSGIDVLSVVAPLIDTPTLRRGFGGGEPPPGLPHIFSAREVVRTALEQLPIGPCYVFPAGPEQDTAEAVTAARRQRVASVMEISRKIFGDD